MDDSTINRMLFGDDPSAVDAALLMKMAARRSEFAMALSCPECSGKAIAPSWPVRGDMMGFYIQSNEETLNNPGAFQVNAVCTKCRHDFKVVWDQNPT